jgi:hypothetical protein
MCLTHATADWFFFMSTRDPSYFLLDVFSPVNPQEEIKITRIHVLGNMVGIQQLPTVIFPEGI